MSTLDTAARSADVAWRDALNCIAIDGQGLSAQEVSDFCSVLFLAERVHVVGPGRHEPAAKLLAAQLRTLGYVVHGVDRLGTVEATDTMVMIAGPSRHDRQSTPHPLPRSMTESGAVLLAIAASGCSALLTLADATITIPLPRPRGRTDDSHLARVAFDLMASLTVDVVGRNLAGRIASRSGDPSTAHQPLAAVNTADTTAFVTPGTDEAPILPLDPRRPLRRCKAEGRNWS